MQKGQLATNNAHIKALKLVLQAYKTKHISTKNTNRNRTKHVNCDHGKRKNYKLRWETSPLSD